MRRWKIDVVEPSLDDLLDDEIMTPVMRSAGTSAESLRAALRETACRIAGRARPVDAERCGCAVL
jgi:hypothetical protein